MPFISLPPCLCCTQSATLIYPPHLDSPFPRFFPFRFLRAAFPGTRLSCIKLKSIQPTETPSCGSGNRDKNDFVSWGHIASNHNIRERHTTHQIRGPPMAMLQEMVRLWMGSRVTRALAYFPRLRTAECPDVSRLPTKSKCDDR